MDNQVRKGTDVPDVLDTVIDQQKKESKRAVTLHFNPNAMFFFILYILLSINTKWRISLEGLTYVHLRQFAGQKGLSNLL